MIRRRALDVAPSPARRRATPRRRSRPTAPRPAIPAIVLLPRGKVSTAQLVQPLANGALVLALDTDFDGCMAHRAAAGGRGGRLPRELDEHACASRARRRSRSRSCSSGTGRSPTGSIIPGGNLGNVSALGAGFDMMRRSALIAKRPRIVVAQAARANPLYLRLRATDWRVRAGAGASRRWPPRSRSAIRSRSRRRSARCSATTGSSSRRPRRSWPTPRRAADRTGHVQLPAHRRRARRAREARRARRDRRRDRVVVDLDRQRARSSPSSSCGTTRARSRSTRRSRTIP